MLKVRTLVLAVALATGVSAWSLSEAEAAPTTTKKSEGAGPAEAYKEGQALVKDGKFKDAIPLFEKAAKLDPQNADAYNMLAYSQRRSGQLDAAFENYEKALALDPDHKGAHEYIGEAYLMSGNLEQAEAHLDKLKELCPKGCNESRMLLKSVQRYKETGKAAALDAATW
jgi:Flp pilus assembly protein TadD